MEVLNYEAEQVSVAPQEVEPQDWEEKVYRADIVVQTGNLFISHSSAVHVFLPNVLI
jgi:hypothetical protein